MEWARLTPERVQEISRMDPADAAVALREALCPPPPGLPAPELTTPMVVLAWTILGEEDDDGSAARTLAKLILEAAR